MMKRPNNPNKAAPNRSTRGEALIGVVLLGRKNKKQVHLGRPSNLDSPEDIGRLLRQRREDKNWSIHEAAEDLNMPPDQIEALEEGTYGAFSAEVYAKGAYQRYAKWLGLDSEETRRAMWRSLSSARKEVPLQIHTPQTWLERLIHPRAFIIAAGVLTTLAVGGYVFWQVQSFWQLPSLALTHPKDHIITSDHTIVRGRADSDAHVLVNGQTTLLNEEGIFETELFLHPGINIIEVKAQNAAGRTKRVEIHLLQPRDDGKVKE